ncbi:type VI secretion system-associated FHA domain protein TagH [Sphingomonas paucimobilis]|uniref:Type VI secretion system-associated FHA domain protein TagH n=1 Tax=Sphingomonas paucimobilis TaxID=13689 RepID=A0A7T3A763_SPHPI|nr:type VI secretion system-associated FHA domain protein TagH [Sphingomonas paucimobilis]
MARLGRCRPRTRHRPKPSHAATGQRRMGPRPHPGRLEPWVGCGADTAFDTERFEVAASDRPEPGAPRRPPRRRRLGRTADAARAPGPWRLATRCRRRAAARRLDLGSSDPATAARLSLVQRGAVASDPFVPGRSLGTDCGGQCRGLGARRLRTAERAGSRSPGPCPASGAAALPPERPVPPQAPAAPSAGPDALTAFAQAAGLDPSRLGPDDAARAGALFRRLVAGLVVMVEARARAKAQLGAEATAFSPGGHNPLKYARTPDEAVAMLLGPAQPGFMDADQAIEDAFQDLQSHQVATLRAMQGALRTTLERFSPSAIRARAEAGGVIERILPAARDAALWQAYEREFGGVAQGSDEAFLDMFAKEFRQAYNEQSRRKTT